MKPSLIGITILLLGGIFYTLPNEEKFDSPYLQDPDTWDVVVYGSTVAGIAAAIQVRKMGRSVVLISETDHIGGTTTSGLSASDLNRPVTIGGIARSFYRRIYRYYENPSAWTRQTRSDYFDNLQTRIYGGKDDQMQMQWVFEPHVAKAILLEMLSEQEIKVVYGQIDQDKGVTVRNKTIGKITTTGAMEWKGRVFIDASYGGDLMAAANVSFITGREASTTNDEIFAGFRPTTVLGNDSTKQYISPFKTVGDKTSGLLPYMHPKGDRDPGTADNLTQAYCYRMTLTNDPDNMVPIKKPADYEPLLYEFLARQYDQKTKDDLQKVLNFTPIPNAKTDSNGLDFVGASHHWPNASYADRLKIEGRHKSYTLGMLWFLGNDERVPAQIRDHVKSFGLARDEFLNNDHFPPQIYVREARRMVGEYVMTEGNARHRRHAEDPIALASYALDSHKVSRIVDDTDRVYEEGNFYDYTPKPYEVSYRAMTPKPSEIINLLVPVALSSSHVAYGSLRMEPNYMVFGQAAGAAAAQAAVSNIAVQHIDYKKLRSDLLAVGHITNL